MTYEFEFDVAQRGALLFDADSALAFQPRRNARGRGQREQTDLSLCGAGAPRARADRDACSRWRFFGVVLRVVVLDRRRGGRDRALAPAARDPARVGDGVDRGRHRLGHRRCVVALGLDDWDWGADGLAAPHHRHRDPGDDGGRGHARPARPPGLARPSGSAPASIVAPRPVRAVKTRIAVLRRYRELVRLARREGFGPFLSAAGRAERTEDAGRRAPAARARRGRRRLRQARPDRRDAASTSCRPRSATSSPSCRTAWLPSRSRRSARRSRPSSAARSTRCSPSSTGSRSPRPRSDRRTRARLRTGEAVVVKVQRPGIDDVIERDLAALALLANVAQRRTTFGQGLRSGEMLDQFAESLRAELDFRPRGRRMARDVDAARSRLVRADPARPQRATAPADCSCRSDSTATPSPTPGDSTPPESTATCSPRSCCEPRSSRSCGSASSTPTRTPATSSCSATARLGLIDFGAVGRLDPIQQSAVIDMLAALVASRRGPPARRRSNASPKCTNSDRPERARARARPAHRRSRAGHRRRRALGAAGPRRHAGDVRHPAPRRPRRALACAGHPRRDAPRARAGAVAGVRRDRDDDVDDGAALRSTATR